MTQFPRRHILKLAGTIGALNLGALPSLASASSGTESEWIQKAKLIASDGGDYDRFGYSIALDGDTALIGATGANDSNGDRAGSAYVFTRSAGGWTQQTKLIAHNGDDGDGFGNSVALDGDTAVIGASRDEDPNGWKAGSAYVFTHSAGSWTQQTKLIADDGGRADRFGESVALDGNTALIGAPQNEGSTGGHAGSTYVFSRSDGAGPNRQNSLPMTGPGSIDSAHLWR